MQSGAVSKCPKTQPRHVQPVKKKREGLRECTVWRCPRLFGTPTSMFTEAKKQAPIRMEEEAMMNPKASDPVKA